MKRRAIRWAVLVSSVALAAAAVVLAFLLAMTTRNSALLEQHYGWLLPVNLALAVLLALVIAIAAGRLAMRLRRGKFGSRLLLKLAGIFALVGLLPGLLIYTVSYQFLTRSIESWFDVQVEGALDAGLNLGRSSLDVQARELESKTRLAAERLAETGGRVQLLTLERLREQLGASEVSLLTGSGGILMTAGTAALAPERVPTQMLRQARAQRAVAQVEGLDEEAGTARPRASATGARVRAAAYVPESDINFAGEERYLVVTQLLPEALVRNALAVQAAFREYQQRTLARQGLRNMFVGTLTLALVLSVFGALLLAVALGNQLVRPLLLLAEGVREVAAGDLSTKPVFTSRDELGGLTRSFAEMTGQLADARAQVQRSVAQLESARTRLQTILDSMSAGVIVFDRDGRIDTVNPGATGILRLPLSAYRGRSLADVPGLRPFAEAIDQRFALHQASPEAGERDHWQDQFELQTAPDEDTLTLLVRGAGLPGGARLMVFDDISDVVSAQRQAAWGEVARRVAHEIKNPLTPIQLSAERIQHRLEGRLEPGDAAVLNKSVATIVTQVRSMKRLVDEFRDYARLPSAQLAPLDLNALVTEVLALYVTPQESGVLDAKCDPSVPLILGDASQLRQVIHNLVQNGLDAVADQHDGHVRVSTEVARADNGATSAVRLTVVDNGPGFADKVLKRAFEPYVTTKSKGTGLGLAVVKKIAEEHGARLRVGNLGESDSSRGASRGAQVSLSFSKLAPSEGMPAMAADDHQAAAAR
jgi:nitrogen fixation/metabolism regulation signal transduction histidine kinase